MQMGTSGRQRWAPQCFTDVISMLQDMLAEKNTEEDKHIGLYRSNLVNSNELFMSRKFIVNVSERHNNLLLFETSATSSAIRAKSLELLTVSTIDLESNMAITFRTSF